MFCGCKNDPDEEMPNTNICPVCMAHPGTLPVANKQAIENVVKVGLAVGANIADFTEFDRKNYYYPDIPKGYQISQYKYPIVSGGTLNGIDITRIHIEEDTGTSKHDRGDFTLVDYNRAGVPLMELVTEPVIHSAKDAGDFAREFQLLLRYLGVSEANMEKGEMRVEANISLSDDEGKFGTKVEVKNLNSFKTVEKAIEYELSRMEAMYEAGRQDEIVQETRGWNEAKQNTFSQRSKENANDYRYFPDPDLPKMKLHSIFNLDEMKNNLPELPWQARENLKKIIKNEEVIELFVQDKARKEFLESIETKYPEIAANYIVSSISGTDLGKSNPKEFGKLIDMTGDKKVTSSATKEIIAILINEGGDPEIIGNVKGLLQDSNEDTIKPIIENVIKENEKIVSDYKAGKGPAMQALIGLVMKASKGSANPAITAKILKEILG